MRWTIVGAYDIIVARHMHVKFFECKIEEKLQPIGHEQASCMQHPGHDFFKRKLLAYLLPCSLPSFRQTARGQPGPC